MPRCSDVVSLLADYLEQQLPADTQRHLDEHLRGCKSCEASLNTYRSTVSLLRSLTEDDLPPDLRARLEAFLDRGPTN